MNARTAWLSALACLLLAESAAAQALACATRSNTPGTRIDEAGYVKLGGIEQWVTIRGDERAKPVLLHVHGGPGIAFSAFAAEFAPYEADFIVVQWDQRGAGCTYERSGAAAAGLTLEQLASDGLELAAYLHTRLGRPRIVLLGHSFGSIVAAEMAHRAPEQFALYVGTGQVASFAATVDAQVALLRARAAGDPELAAALEPLAALASSSLEKFGAVNRLLATRMPAVDAGFMQRLQPRAAEVMMPSELASWQAGRQASAGRLAPQLPAVDLAATTRGFAVPFAIVQGADDLNTPSAAARAYFEVVDAPGKEFVVIAGAGHFAHLTHATEFLAVLRDLVGRFAAN